MEDQEDEKPAVIVAIIEGRYVENRIESVCRAAEIVYDTLVVGNPGCETIQSIKVDNVEIWKYETRSKALGSLFKLMYPEGVSKTNIKVIG